MSKLSLAAKENLLGIAKEADRRLADWWEGEIKGRFGFNRRQRELVEGMLRHAKEHNLRPAKRLRASLVLNGYRLSGKEVDERLWRAALAVELVHTALLMHDDFMDQDGRRRGGPTTQWFFAKRGAELHYGESMAVNLGDAVLCLGFEELASCGVEVTKQMLREIAKTAYGQAYDLTLGKEGVSTEEDVLVLHRAKTAIYTYENPLLIGAFLGGLSREVKEALKEYAKNAGVAFQLQDDILGVFGSEEETGKSADSDLKQGKCTLLVLKTLEQGTDEQRSALRKVWGKVDAGEDDLKVAKRVIEESGALSYSRRLAREMAEKATVAAEGLRGLGVDNEAVDYLVGIAEYMVERKV